MSGDLIYSNICDVATPTYTDFKDESVHTKIPWHVGLLVVRDEEK